jgi:hypothetical protein
MHVIANFQPLVVQIMLSPRMARGAGFGKDHRELWLQRADEHVVKRVKSPQMSSLTAQSYQRR